jgi:carboxypeptidase Taq
MPAEAYTKLTSHLKDIYLLGGVSQILDWDREVYMPKSGAEVRADHIALVAGIMHDRQTSDELGQALETLEANGTNGDPAAATNVREARRDYDRAVKLPTSLVQEIAKATSLAQHVWQKSRADSDFSQFAPHLEKLLDLSREKADKLGWTTERYDALMDVYEPGARAAEVQAIFNTLRAELVPLVQAIKDAPRQPDLSILKRDCPVEHQKAFNDHIAKTIGFGFDAGRIDISTHPFCTSTAPSDVRLTTRFDKNYMPMSLFGVMHEAGHGMYEQGLPGEHFGSPMCEPVSLGIHESQSRMWENFLGDLHNQFASLADVTLDDWYFAINNVRPSLIRVEADEVTYGLHIMLRFDLERQIIDGKLDVKDIPEAWNEAMRAGLGVVPDKDADGCLQDVHWSCAIFGYFPTYQLGNVYAAQLFAAARRAMPDLDDQFRAGRFADLLGWLRENVHQHGRRFKPGELIERATGQPVSHEPYIAALKAKFEPLYGLA